MTADEAVTAVIDALDAARVPFMVVGSLASNVHGIPRSTRDADFVVALSPGDLARLRSVLPAGLALDAQGGFEAVTGPTRYVIRLTGSPFICESFVLSADPHDEARFARRLQMRVFDRSVYVATAEDMIVTKLRWARDADRWKDREDVRSIIAVRGRELDWEYVRRWAAVHGTSGLLAAIQGSLPGEQGP